MPQKVKTVEVLSSAARMKLWHSDWREVFAMAVAVVEAHDRGLRAIARIGVSKDGVMRRWLKQNER